MTRCGDLRVVKCVVKGVVKCVVHDSESYGASDPNLRAKKKINNTNQKNNRKTFHANTYIDQSVTLRPAKVTLISQGNDYHR